MTCSTGARWGIGSEDSDSAPVIRACVQCTGLAQPVYQFCVQAVLSGRGATVNRARFYIKSGWHHALNRGGRFEFLILTW